MFGLLPPGRNLAVQNFRLKDGVCSIPRVLFQNRNKKMKPRVGPHLHVYSLSHQTGTCRPSSPMNLQCISPPGSPRMNRKRPKKTEFPFCEPHFKTAFNLPCDLLNINQALTQIQQMGQRTVGPFISARETHRFPGLTKFPVFIYFLKPCIIEPQNH